MALVSFKYFIVLVVAIVAYFFGGNIHKKIVSNGLFREIINHNPGNCFSLDGIKGAEDMHQLSDGKVIISSDLGNFLNPKEQKPNRKGHLFTIDLSTANKKLIDLKLPKELDPKLFFPHGITVLERPGKLPQIYVINHDLTADRVEKLEWDTSTNELTHLKTFTSPLFTNINDLVVLDEDVFYTTVYSRFTSSIMRQIDGTFQLSLGYVILYNKDGASIQIEGLSMPNGINLSNDKKLLYLTQSGGQNLQIYKRHSIDKFELLQDVPLYTLPDNIFVGKNGDLLIGCHPKVIPIFKYLHDTTLTSPSQVLRVKIEKEKVVSVTEVLLDDGQLVSASAIAVMTKDTLLVGTVASELLMCKINQDYLP